MEKENIEARDREFRDKLGQMRMNLASRQVQADRKENDIRSYYKVAIPVLVILAAAVYFAGKTIQGDRPESTSTPNEPQITEHRFPVPPDRTETDGAVAETEKTDGEVSRDILSDESMEKPDESASEAPVPETPGATGSLSASEDVKSEDVSVETETSANLEAGSEAPPKDRTSSPAMSAEERPSSGETDSVAAEDAQPYETEEVETEPYETEEIESETPETVEPEKAEPETSTPSPDGLLSPRGTRVAEYSVCSNVIARECVAPQSSFPLKQGRNPHFWMDVHSDSVPYVLKHVYYHEGRKYVEVPLEIEYPRMRTWSYITLTDSTPTGSWRVQIETEDGTVLGRAEFTITAGE